MPSIGCSTNVLTNSGHLRAEMLQEALIFKPPPAVPDLLNSPVFMGLTTYADDVRVTSITTEQVHTLLRVMANNAALDNALEEMAGSVWPPSMARCFLARQDRLLGTSALTSTSWAASDPNLNDGVRRHFEPGLDSAQCGFVRASH